MHIKIIKTDIDVAQITIQHESWTSLPRSSHSQLSFNFNILSFFFSKMILFLFLWVQAQNPYPAHYSIFFSGSYPPHQIEIPLNTCFLIRSRSFPSVTLSTLLFEFSETKLLLSICDWFSFSLTHKKSANPKQKPIGVQKEAGGSVHRHCPVMCYKTPFPIFFFIVKF